MRTLPKRLIAAALLGIVLAFGVVASGSLVQGPTTVLADGPGSGNGGNGGKP